jgi:outer membrane protein OmpA-like peptidoglycan-associated protein
VTGHTDSTGAADHNERLSDRRARSVADYLGTHGVHQVRLLVEGFADQRPVASNGTPEGRAQNRRVELTLEPLTG